jgi:hypothetical protein
VRCSGSAFFAQFHAPAAAGSLTEMEGLRRRCERLLRGTRIPHPFDLDAFCAGLAARRGRPLHLRPVPGLSSDAPCGLWIGTADADHVFYDPGTSPLHAEHIVLHELAHILSGHSGSDGAFDRLFPDLDPATVRLALGRVGYTTEQEREAEMIASLIRGRSAPASHTTLGRVADVFGFAE